MADQYAYAGMPGPSAVAATVERNAILGPITWYLLKGIIINGSASSDAGNTPTTDLRHGLLMAQRTSDGFYANYGPNATDGTDLVHGFLWEQRSTIDSDGTTVNRPGQLVVAGYVKASQLLLLDEESRRQMAGRFILDDRLVAPIGGFKRVIAKTANYTVLAADNDTLFTTTGNAGAITFTLPAITGCKGMVFTFYNTVDQNMIVAAPANKLVAFNNAAATSVALQTAGQKIGGGFEVSGDDTSAKWLALPIVAGHTVTVA